MGKKKDKTATADLDDAVADVQYRIQCQYAIDMVEMKLQMIQEELAEEYGRMIVSNICSRIKTAESIRKKLTKKKLPISFQTAQERLNDMIGVRVTFLRMIYMRL